ncbi:MAG: acetyltransferase [Acidobacteria bacterium]|nr:acetyltransferase [Acidobacteriota bacterium]MBI3656039.1 acetyltransferase [Acidobacteriota bacterium]
MDMTETSVEPVASRWPDDHRMNYPILIVGAGGHGLEVFSYIRALADHGQPQPIFGFVDENKTAGCFETTMILGGFEALAGYVPPRADGIFYYITAVGNNQARMKLVKKMETLSKRNLIPWTLCHPQATIGLDVSIGEGSCVAPGCIITTRVRIGKHCILNVNASVSHDAVVGDYVNLNPGAVVCGNVQIGKGCFIGAGATIIDKVAIGDGTIIGAGAVVTNNLPAHVTAVGVPACIIKRHTS